MLCSQTVRVPWRQRQNRKVNRSVREKVLEPTRSWIMNRPILAAALSCTEFVTNDKGQSISSEALGMGTASVLCYHVPFLSSSVYIRRYDDREIDHTYLLSERRILPLSVVKGKNCLLCPYLFWTYMLVFKGSRNSRKVKTLWAFLISFFGLWNADLEEREHEAKCDIHKGL